MADTDRYVIEAVRKTVESDVEQRVYAKIKTDILRLKFIGGVGGALIALAFIFYQPIFSFIVSQGGSEFKQEIKRSFAAEEKEVRDQVSDIRAIRKIMSEELGRLHNEVAERHRDIVRLKSEFEKQRADLEAEKRKLDDMMAGLRDGRDVITERIAAAQSTVLQLQVYIEESTEKLNALIRNQTTLVSDLKTSSEKYEQVEPLAPVAAQKQTQPPRSAPRKSTAYFQFAGFTREEARRISDGLQNEGWAIPGEERTTFAVNTNEIRFHPKDRLTAEMLKQDADRMMQSFGLPITLSLRDNPKVKEGVPEIWLYKR
jgi:hypothetical protein